MVLQTVKNGLWAVAEQGNSITGLSSNIKFYGGVLAPNGRIYGIPYNSTFVLIINPVTNTTNGIGGLSSTLAKWVGGVLASNGKIYGIPNNSTSVLIIDPVTNTANTTTITGLTGSGKWLGGVLAPNGKIYGIPYNATSVLIIETGLPSVGKQDWMLRPYFNKL